MTSPGFRDPSHLRARVHIVELRRRNEQDTRNAIIIVIHGELNTRIEHEGSLQPAISVTRSIGDRPAMSEEAVRSNFPPLTFLTDAL